MHTFGAAGSPVKKAMSALESRTGLFILFATVAMAFLLHFLGSEFERGVFPPISL